MHSQKKGRGYLYHYFTAASSIDLEIWKVREASFLSVLLNDSKSCMQPAAGNTFPLPSSVRSFAKPLAFAFDDEVLANFSSPSSFPPFTYSLHPSLHISAFERSKRRRREKWIRDNGTVPNLRGAHDERLFE